MFVLFVKETLIIYVILSLYQVGFLQYLLLAFIHSYSISVLKSILAWAYHWWQQWDWVQDG